MAVLHETRVPRLLGGNWHLLIVLDNSATCSRRVQVLLPLNASSFLEVRDLHPRC